MPKNRWVSAAQEKRIASVGHFRNSDEGKIGADDLVRHYMAWYVDPLLMLNPTSGPTSGPTSRATSMLDAGTGYGWLAFAFALRTPFRITAFDRNERRLKAAREIASILDLADRIEFVAGELGSLPFRPGRFDLTFCIEVLEHVGAARAQAAQDLARVTADLLVVTTPNRLFPAIGHDTQLPLCHMLPMRLRDRYAAWFGRQKLQDGNLFWSARELRSIFPDFERISRFLHFPDYQAYVDANSQELGHPNPVSASASTRARSAYYGLARLAGRYSDFLMPNVASTFRRRKPV